MTSDQIHSLAVPLEYLAGALANILGHPVYHRTGISGKYDYRLNYTRTILPIRTAIPSIFSALEQQLGLKLEAAKGSVESVVIDQVEKLKAN